MRTRNVSGFTLIELLVALSVFSLIAVAVYSTFSTGIKAREKGEDASAVFQEARVILGRLTKELRNTIGYSSYKFMGGNESISFPTLTRRGDHQEISYVVYSMELNDEDGSRALRRQEKTRLALSENDVSSTAESLNFDYGYLPDGNESIVWTDSWNSDDQRGYPTAVRITLTLVQGDDQLRRFTKLVYIPVTGSFD